MGTAAFKQWYRERCDSEEVPETPAPRYLMEDGSRFLGGVTIGHSEPIGCDPVTEVCDPPSNGFVQVASGATASASGSNVFRAGVLGGEGTFLVTGSFDWSSDPKGAATQRDAGVTRIDEGAEMRVNGPFGVADPTCGALCGGVNFSFPREIVNDGSVLIERAGYITADDGTRFVNNGTFNIRNDRGYFRGFELPEQPGDFINAGRVLKTESDADSIIDTLYSGNGDVDNETRGDLLIPLRGETHVLRGHVDPDASLSTGSTDEDADSPVVVPRRHFGATVINSDVDRHYLQIRESTPSGTPYGYEIVGATVSLQNLSTTNDLIAAVLISIDSQGLAGENEESLIPLLDNEVLPECTEAGPPCVQSRSGTDEGDVQIELTVEFEGGEEADLELASAPGARTVVLDDGGFDPRSVSLKLGDSIRWQLGGSGHKPRDKVLLDGGRPLFARFDRVSSPYSAAGKFGLVDNKPGSSHSASVTVTPDVQGRTVIWSRGSLGCDGCRFHVRYRKAGKSGWNSDITQNSRMRFKSGTWEIKVRLVNGSLHSGWVKITRSF